MNHDALAPLRMRNQAQDFSMAAGRRLEAHREAELRSHRDGF